MNRLKTSKQLEVRQYNVITYARHDLTTSQLDIYFIFHSKLKPVAAVNTISVFRRLKP